MNFTLEGNDCSPPISGGYLVVYRDGVELSVVSVPPPNLLADRHRDSVIENEDTFEDEEGNEYNVSVMSSNVGVDWSIDVVAEDSDFAEQIRVEYLANEF